MCHFSLKALSQKGLFHQPSRRRAPSLAGFFHPRQRAELPEPHCLAVSLRTAQQGQHKGVMSFTVQWKVKAERKLVITAFQLAVEMFSPLISPSYAQIDIFPTNNACFNHNNYHQTISLLSSQVPRNSINVLKLTQQYRTMSLWGIFPKATDVT